MPHTGNVLHSSYIVLGIICNLQMIESIWEDVGSKDYTILCKGLEHLRSWVFVEGSGTSPRGH